MISEKESDKVVASINELLVGPKFVMGEVALANKLGIGVVVADLFLKTMLAVLVAEGKVILVKRDE